LRARKAKRWSLARSIADSLCVLRDTSYPVRQICDVKLGNAAGTGSKMMTGVVEELKEEDSVALAAYRASLRPSVHCKPIKSEVLVVYFDGELEAAAARDRT
jgi:hypothetical protein